MASNVIRERELQFVIDEFMADTTKKVHNFPASLNSWERQVVHAYCELIKIKHESKGEGMHRLISISKLPTS